VAWSRYAARRARRTRCCAVSGGGAGRQGRWARGAAMASGSATSSLGGTPRFGRRRRARRRTRGAHPTGGAGPSRWPACALCGSPLPGSMPDLLSEEKRVPRSVSHELWTEDTQGHSAIRDGTEQHGTDTRIFLSGPVLGVRAQIQPASWNVPADHRPVTQPHLRGRERTPATVCSHPRPTNDQQYHLSTTKPISLRP
jgi:hypothetical protein